MIHYSRCPRFGHRRAKHYQERVEPMSTRYRRHRLRKRRLFVRHHGCTAPSWLALLLSSSGSRNVASRKLIPRDLTPQTPDRSWGTGPANRPPRLLAAAAKHLASRLGSIPVSSRLNNCVSQTTGVFATVTWFTFRVRQCLAHGTYPAVRIRKRAGLNRLHLLLGSTATIQVPGAQVFAAHHGSFTFPLSDTSRQQFPSHT